MQVSSLMVWPSAPTVFEGARLWSGLCGERHLNGGAHCAAPAAVAQHDHLFDLGGRFTAGIIPGLLFAVSLMVTAYFVARSRGYPTEPFPGLAAALHLGAIAVPGLLLIAIIFGGVRSGASTATESSCVAVIYALLVTIFVYRQMSWRHFVHSTLGAVKTT